MNHWCLKPPSSIDLIRNARLRACPSPRISGASLNSKKCCPAVRTNLAMGNSSIFTDGKSSFSMDNPIFSHDFGDVPRFSPSVPMIFWLVVWNIYFIVPYIGNNKPNWLIFFRGVETTNQIFTDWCFSYNYGGFLKRWYPFIAEWFKRENPSTNGW